MAKLACVSVLLGVSLAAQFDGNTVSPAVLPEEPSLELGERLLDRVYALTTDGRSDVQGWVWTTVERAELDGAPVVLFCEESEIVDTERLEVQRTEERSLWSEELELIRMRRGASPLGAEPRWREWTWADGRLRPRDFTARGGSNLTPSTPRPSAPARVQVLARDFERGEPIELSLLDPDQTEVEPASLVYDRDVRFGHGGREVEVRRIALKQGERYEYFYDLAGEGLIGAALDGSDIVMRTSRRGLANLADEVHSSPTLTALWTNHSRDEWEFKSGFWRNELLGIKFKPGDKTWKQLSFESAASLLLADADDRWTFELSVEFRAAGVALDDYARAFEPEYVAQRSLVPDEIERRSTKRGRDTASFSFEDQDTGATHTVSVLFDRGLCYRVIAVSEGPKPEEGLKELAQALKSMRFIRRVR